jgi:sugar (pentulose or hexulose) kinase
VVRIAEEVQPNARDSATLDQAYRSYRKIYPALQEIANATGAEAAISSTTLSIS